MDTRRVLDYDYPELHSKLKEEYPQVGDSLSSYELRRLIPFYYVKNNGEYTQMCVCSKECFLNINTI